MASTASARLRLEKQATGENTNTWGTRLGSGLIDRVDEAVGGWAKYALSGTKTLTANNFTADEARMRIQHITGGSGGTVTIPAVEMAYTVKNDATGTVTFTIGSGATAAILPGDVVDIICDGTDVTKVAANQPWRLISSATISPGDVAVTFALSSDPRFSNAMLLINEPYRSGSNYYPVVFISNDGVSYPGSTDDLFKFTFTSTLKPRGAVSIPNFRAGRGLLSGSFGRGILNNSMDTAAVQGQTNWEMSAGIHSLQVGIADYATGVGGQAMTGGSVELWMS